MSSIQSLQRKISRLPRGEVLVLVTCTKKNLKGQESEEWAVYGSEALQRAARPYLSTLHVDLVPEKANFYACICNVLHEDSQNGSAISAY